MPRKKRTAIKGSDPAYTSDFSQPLPTHKVAEKPETIPAPEPPSTQPIKPQKSKPKAKDQQKNSRLWKKKEIKRLKNYCRRINLQNILN